jgi:hypothetical protein
LLGTLLLNSGILPALFSTLVSPISSFASDHRHLTLRIDRCFPSAAQFGAATPHAVYQYEGGAGWRRVYAEGARVNGAVLSLTVVAALTYALFRLAAAMQRDGAARTLRRAFLQEEQRGGARRRQAGTQRERHAEVSALIQKLPVEVHHTREQLAAMSVGELKAVLAKAGRGGGAAARGCLEKHELLDAVLVRKTRRFLLRSRVLCLPPRRELTFRRVRLNGMRGVCVCVCVCVLQGAGNSTVQNCSICCEDYAAGDVLRALRCGHRYHLECVDKWFLASVDYSRAPACPVCNAELAAG